MYDQSMAEISQNLMKESPTNKFLYTAELHPQGSLKGTDWRLVPKVGLCLVTGAPT
jgi:hypothetical protein